MPASAARKDRRALMRALYTFQRAHSRPLWAAVLFGLLTCIGMLLWTTHFARTHQFHLRSRGVGIASFNPFIGYSAYTNASAASTTTTIVPRSAVFVPASTVSELSWIRFVPALLTSNVEKLGLMCAEVDSDLAVCSQQPMATAWASGYQHCARGGLHSRSRVNVPV